MNKLKNNDEQHQVTVYFDGACPLCRREINLYRGFKGANNISWVDVSSQEGTQCAPDLSKEAALKRFHIRCRDGKLASGAAAFAGLWMAFPGLRWAGRILALPGIRHIAEVIYIVFLRVRPLLQKITPR